MLICETVMLRNRWCILSRISAFLRRCRSNNMIGRNTIAQLRGNVIGTNVAEYKVLVEVVRNVVRGASGSDTRCKLDV